MSETKQAPAGDGNDAAGAQGEAPAKQDAAPKTYDEGYVKKLREEAKANRERAESLAADKAAAEKAKAEAEGNVTKLREIEAAEKKALADELATAKKRAADADAFEAAEKRRVDAAIAGLSDEDKALVADLPLYRQFELANRLAAKSAPPAVGARKPGAPAGTEVPVDLSKMNAAQVQEYLRSNPNERKRLLAQASAKSDPFGGR